MDEKKNETVEPVVLKDPDTQPSDGNGEGVTSPIDEVTKLSETELLKFNNLNLKIERAEQGVRILQFENEAAHRRYVTETHQRNRQIEVGQNTVGRLRKDLEELAYELADKYGIPAKYLAIDDETGVVRELPRGPEDTPPPTEDPTN
jgi:predicted RNase H-like nuclease (RuvC/YqgF family)